MSQKVLNWRSLPTVFGKRSPFTRWGKRPAGALVYLDLGSRNGHPHSHSGTKGPHYVTKSFDPNISPYKSIGIGSILSDIQGSRLKLDYLQHCLWDEKTS